MGDIPRELLCSLIRQQGSSIIHDSTKFRNLLNDFFQGQYKRERKCLSDSLSENVPDTLLTRKNQLPYATLSQQLCQKLIQDLGVNSDLAKWTVDSWAIAFGIILDEETQPHDYTFFIISNPPGAKVSLNNILKGITPLNLKNLELKTYQLLVSHEGYEPWVQSLSLDSRTNSTLTINLTKKAVQSGSIIIETYPHDAEIYLNSKKYGKTPKEIQNLAEGYYEIKLTHPGYKEIIQHRQITPGTNQKIRETLIQEHIQEPPPKTGNLFIDSLPSGASVYINNQFVGNTPVRVQRLSPGNYTIALKLSLYAESRKRIQVKSGEDLRVYETLVKQKKSFLKKAIYALCLLVLLVFLIGFFSSGVPSISPTASPSVNPQTSASNNVITDKDLAIRPYGDYLSEGQINTYFFDVSNDDANNRLLVVTAETQPNDDISTAVGIGYEPSIDNNKFDYVSADSSTNVIDIYNPKPGRYYVVVNGVQGSGYTSVSRSFYK
jgi:hypothetical protein